MRNNKGITMIALIITIIVLLILAGISIAMLTGNNGLLEKAKTAKEETKNAEEQENLILSDYENKIDEVVGSRDETTIKQQNTMSDEEHFTGEYYYNGKPIYAKTIYIASLPNSKTATYNHNILNVELIWCDVSKSFCQWSAGHTAPMPFLNNSALSSSIQLSDITTTSFNVRTYSDKREMSSYITLNYTKTTDEGNGKTITATPPN